MPNSLDEPNTADLIKVVVFRAPVGKFFYDGLYERGIVDDERVAFPPEKRRGALSISVSIQIGFLLHLRCRIETCRDPDDVPGATTLAVGAHLDYIHTEPGLAKARCEIPIRPR